MSLPAEIQKKVKLLEIQTRKKVNSLFTGEYHSAFKGQGMTFSEFREYVPGDDIRTISWPLFARTGTPYIKKFDEERETTLMLVVDVSASGDFGSGQYFKGEVVTHLAALLGFAAAKNKDPVGLLLFSDQVEHFVPPKKGIGQMHRILRDLYYHEPQSRKTSLMAPLEYLRGALKKRSNIFILSDFLDSDFELPLRQLGKKHDTAAVVVRDPLELQLPSWGLYDVQDPETGEIMTVDFSSSIFRRQYEENLKKIMKEQDDQLRRSQVPRIEIETSKDIVAPLIAHFQRKARA